MQVIKFLDGIRPFFQLAERERVIFKECFAHTYCRAKRGRQIILIHYTNLIIFFLYFTGKNLLRF